MKLYCETCKGKGRIKNTYSQRNECNDDSEHLTSIILGAKCKDCKGLGYHDVFSSKESLMKLLIELCIEEIEITQEDDGYFVAGCLKNHYGGFDEPPYCQTELEAFGNTQKEALANAVIDVMKQMILEIKEEESWNYMEVEL